MYFFTRNALVVQLLLIAAAFGWIDGGTRPDLLLPAIPWLTLFAVEMLLVFPQCKSTETIAEARIRVWASTVRDPFLYIALAVCVYLAIPMFNVAGAPVFDKTAGQWMLPTVPVPWLPSCVNKYEQACLLLWFPPVLLATVAARNGLLKRGKRMLLEGLCWNAAVLSLLGIWQLATGAEGIFWREGQRLGYFFSTFGYPNFAGAYFTLHWFIALGIWFGRRAEDRIGPQSGGIIKLQDEHGFWTQYGMLFCAGANIVGAIASLSRAAILLVVIGSVVYGVYMFAGAWQKCKEGGRMSLLTALGAVVLISALAFTVLAPASLKKEITTITPEAVFDRVSGAGYHVRVGMEVFKDKPLYGVGGWGYPHWQLVHLTPEERRHMQITGGANVHNDIVQFLAELGVAGTGLLLLCAIWLAAGDVASLSKMLRDLKRIKDTDTRLARPVWLYRLPPETLAIFLGCGATCLHSLGDLPFRNPAVLMTWFCALACADGFIPKIRKTF